MRATTAVVKLLMYARRHPDESYLKQSAAMSGSLANVLVQHLNEVTGKSFVSNLSVFF